MELQGKPSYLIWLRGNPMCGRFTLRAAPQDVARHFLLFDVPNFSPRYNIGPGQVIGAVRAKTDDSPPAIVSLSDGGQRTATTDLPVTPTADPNREWAWFRWGLIPHWSDDPAIGNRLINARAETVASKPAFRSAARYRRCLIPADGFYEWKATPRGKQPYLVRVHGDRIFALAGLWDRWPSPSGEILETCTILTVEPNRLVAKLHNRMPLILPPEAYPIWLDPTVTQFDELREWLRPYPEEDLELIPVSSYVNAIHNEGAKCIEPVGESGELFSEGAT